MANEVDYSQVSEFNKALTEMVGRVMPRETRNFMQREGNKLSKAIKAAYRSGVGKKTGNLVKGVKRGRAYVYKVGDYQVRVKDQAPHAHLIEYGHVFYRRGKKTDKYVHGYHIVGTQANAFYATFGADASKFIDELLEEI